MVEFLEEAGTHVFIFLCDDIAMSLLLICHLEHYRAILISELYF